LRPPLSDDMEADETQVRRPMVQVLLFDLGGVLVEFSGVRDVASLLLVDASEDEIRARWSSCRHCEAFGLGRLSREEFAERFVRDWGIDMAPEHFLGEFRSWSRRLLPGATELLASVRSRFRLAALSNSNEVHWERNTQDLGVTGLFDVALSSHQLGLCKPDPEIYLVALERLDVRPDGVMFFDDVSANVAAASELGIRSFQVNGVEEVREQLVKERIL
jgi:epoxide hydrolase-like predicted phosphatase